MGGAYVSFIAGCDCRLGPGGGVVCRCEFVKLSPCPARCCRFVEKGGGCPIPTLLAADMELYPPTFLASDEPPPTMVPPMVPMRDVRLDTVDATLAFASSVSDTASMPVWSLFTVLENRLDAAEILARAAVAGEAGGGSVLWRSGEG